MLRKKKEKSFKPNYRGGSVVNLMASVGRALGYPSRYQQLDLLPAKELAKSKNVVIFLIDGLGYEFLTKYGKKSCMKQHLKGKMTSVFPSTTTSSVTSFMTGVAPQQHALTGWFMYAKEVATIIKPIRYSTRQGNIHLSNFDVKVKDLISCKSFFSKIKPKSFFIGPDVIADSEYTNTSGFKATFVKFEHENVEEMFVKTRRVIKGSNRKKYIYTYWPGFDSREHEFGVNHKEVKRHFKELDEGFSKFLDSIEGSNTTVILTADHGQINCGKKKTVIVNKHPGLAECLRLPLGGEPRVAYCYVNPSKAKQFEEYVKTKLAKYCDIYKSETLVKRNYFGLGPVNPKLYDRIGDYVLIMKKNYAIRDFLPGEEFDFNVADHGGLSKEEMFVPLVVVKV
jgi:hypothetical protein